MTTGFYMMSTKDIAPDQPPKMIIDKNFSYVYLEQIRDYIYKDVVLADTKAGFALTIVAVSLAVFAATVEKIDYAKSPYSSYIVLTWFIGVFTAIFSVLCSLLTILPRSYVSHEMAKNPDHWVHPHHRVRNSLKRRVLDASYVLFENIWQKQTKGTTQSLDLLLRSNSEEAMVAALYESMRRAFLVQNLKFLWVGKSILLAFASLIAISTSYFISFIPYILLYYSKS